MNSSLCLWHKATLPMLQERESDADYPAALSAIHTAILLQKPVSPRLSWQAGMYTDRAGRTW